MKCGAKLCTCECGYGFTNDTVEITMPECVSYGVWTDVSGCSMINCGPMTPPTGYVSISQCVATSFGSVCQLTCAPGYSGLASEIECLGTGSWSSPTGCNIVSCPRFVAPRGYVKKSYCDSTYGTVWYVSTVELVDI